MDIDALHKIGYAMAERERDANNKQYGVNHKKHKNKSELPKMAAQYTIGLIILFGAAEVVANILRAIVRVFGLIVGSLIIGGMVLTIVMACVSPEFVPTCMVSLIVLIIGHRIVTGLRKKGRLSLMSICITMVGCAIVPVVLLCITIHANMVERRKNAPVRQKQMHPDVHDYYAKALHKLKGAKQEVSKVTAGASDLQAIRIIREFNDKANSNFGDKELAEVKDAIDSEFAIAQSRIMQCGKDVGKPNTVDEQMCAVGDSVDDSAPISPAELGSAKPKQIQRIDMPTETSLGNEHGATSAVTQPAHLGVEQEEYARTIREKEKEEVWAYRKERREALMTLANKVKRDVDYQTWIEITNGVDPGRRFDGKLSNLTYASLVDGKRQVDAAYDECASQLNDGMDIAKGRIKANEYLAARTAEVKRLAAEIKASVDPGDWYMEIKGGYVLEQFDNNSRLNGIVRPKTFEEAKERIDKAYYRCVHELSNSWNRVKHKQGE